MRTIIRYTDKIFEFFVIGMFITMVITGGMQVFNRFILNNSLSWSEELQRYLHIWIVFFTIPLAYNRNMHIGMTSVREKLPAAVGHVLDIMDHVLWIAFGLSIIVFSQRILEVTSRQTSPGLGISMNVVYSALVGSSGYLIFVAVRKLVNTVAGKELLP
ncbi:MAG: TRAP transporter small permease [Spirochaetia bacterium]|nr:TRAP transporter small permease [Spirochaetia bacterium]MCF7940842.1 TRAP transporter small permease [Spirochaetia bacterium]